jgi:hypothetical protein
MCYKSEMSKIVEQWLLFKYVGLEFTPLSKPFNGCSPLVFRVSPDRSCS